VVEEVMRMMLEIINSCLSNSLHHNPHLVYTLLYRRDLFTQLLAHSAFHDVTANIHLVISISLTHSPHLVISISLMHSPHLVISISLTHNPHLVYTLHHSSHLC